MRDGTWDPNDRCAEECRGRFIQRVAEDLAQPNFPEMPPHVASMPFRTRLEHARQFLDYFEEILDKISRGMSGFP